MALSTAIDVSALARVLGIQVNFKNLRSGDIFFLPQRIALIGQGTTLATYATTKRQVTSALEVANIYGFGSPLHLAAQQLFPINGDGIGTIPVTIYPLVDDASGVVSDGDITPTIAGSENANYIIRVNNIDTAAFTIAVGDSVASVVATIAAAINAQLDIPIIAVDGTTLVTFTSKWDGASANGIVVQIVGPTDIGNTFAITQAANGATNPDVDLATALIGDVWVTMILNCMESTDTTTLTKYTTFGEGRWGALTKKPLVVFTGDNEASVATAITVPDARKADRINCQLVAPGSNNLPFVIAARELSRIAKVANNNPPQDYGSQNAMGLIPGDDSEQWDYVQRDLAIKGGSSTIEVKNEIVNISDVVTFYHPDGDPLPAYRYVVDIVKLQNIIFNINLIFATAEWDGAPLIPDDQPTVNRTAKKPKMAVAAVSAMLDSLGLNAIISDPKTAKKNTFAEIDPSNPKRLNLVTTVQLSGNSNQISIDLDFGFFFGPQVVI